MEKIAKKTKFKDLKKNQVPLTPEERAEVMKRKAVWHYNGGSPSPAVWKSVDKKTGEVTCVTHTHRAFNTAPTVKGAIGRFHSFIKSTASENVDDRIEKTALNAQKAREMAKGLGLVTDGDWRWALRNLRNMKTGDVLKGRELAEAKRKMGAMSNNAWQKVKSKTRGLASKTEIGGRYDKKTGRVSDITVGAPRAHNVDGANELDNFHTHPGNGGENKWTFVHQMKNQTRFNSKEEWRAFEENMARHVPEVTEWKDRNKRIPAIADLSGGIGSYNKLSLGKHEGRPILNKIKKLEDEQAGIENMKSTLIRSSAHAKGKKVANKEIKTSTIIGDNANLNRSERAYDKFNKRYWDNYEKINKLKEKPVHAIKMPSDVDTFMEYAKKNNRPYAHNIVAPDQNYEGLHRIGPGYKRSVIFDRTPKKAR